MNKPQAKSILAILSAAFPRDPMPQSTVEMWARALEDVDIEDARNAAELAALTQDRMPSLHSLLDLAEDEKRERLRQGRSALPAEPPAGTYISFREWIASRPDMHDRVRKLGPAFRKLVDGQA